MLRTNLVFPTLLPFPELSTKEPFVFCCSLKISEVDTERLDMLAVDDDGMPFEFDGQTVTSVRR